MDARPGDKSALFVIVLMIGTVSLDMLELVLLTVLSLQ